MDKQKRILKTLNDFGRLSSARLSSICGINYDSFLETSSKMCDEGLIIKFKETTATYWKISDEGKEEILK